MPARANAKIADTVENRLGVAFQNGLNDQIYVGRAKTTAASAVNVLFEGGNSPNYDGLSGGKLRIPEGTVVSGRAIVSCCNATDDPATNLNYGNGYVFDFVIRNLNGTTALPVAGVTVTALDTTASHALPAANVVVTADDVNDALNIAVTGVASKTHYWEVILIVSSTSFFG